MNDLERQCAGCDNQFKPVRSFQRYCRSSCANKSHRNKKRSTSAYPEIPLSSGTIGAISELKVCANLMEKGYHVFRAMSPNCPSDLIAFRDGELPRRVQVKTGNYRNNGSITYPRLSNDCYEILAVVLQDGIQYVPDTI